jgi:hypothetical protein
MPLEVIRSAAHHRFGHGDGRRPAYLGVGKAEARSRESAEEPLGCQAGESVSAGPGSR